MIGHISYQCLVAYLTRALNFTLSGVTRILSGIILYKREKSFKYQRGSKLLPFQVRHRFFQLRLHRQKWQLAISLSLQCHGTSPAYDLRIEFSKYMDSLELEHLVHRVSFRLHCLTNNYLAEPWPAKLDKNYKMQQMSCIKCFAWLENTP